MDAAEIMRINKEAFDDVIDYFGEIDGWTPEQAKAFVLKAKDYWKERGSNSPTFTQTASYSQWEQWGPNN